MWRPCKVMKAVSEVGKSVDAVGKSVGAVATTLGGLQQQFNGMDGKLDQLLGFAHAIAASEKQCIVICPL